MKSYLLALFSLLVVNTELYARPFVHQVAQKDFQEQFHDDMQVSNDSIVYGLQFGSTDFKPEKMQVQVTGLKPNDAFICLVFRHISGIYEASAVVKNDNFPTNLSIVLPSENFANLDSSAIEMAIQAFTSENRDCSEKGAHLPVTWRDFSKQKSALQVLINVSDSVLPRLVVLNNDLEVPCYSVASKMKNSKTVVQQYSHICSVMPAQLGGGDAKLRVFLQRLNRDDYTPLLHLRGLNQTLSSLPGTE